MPTLGKETIKQGQLGSTRLGRESILKAFATHVPDTAHLDLFSVGSFSGGLRRCEAIPIQGEGMLSAPPQRTQVTHWPGCVHFLYDPGHLGHHTCISRESLGGPLGEPALAWGVRVSMITEKSLSCGGGEPKMGQLS